MKRKAVSGITLALFLIGMLPLAFNIRTVEAEPTTWFVDDDFQDYPNANYTKIQHAVNAATTGDSIIVYPGIYIETIKVNKSLTIESAVDTEATVVQPPSSTDYVFEVTTNYVNISGFTIRETGIYLMQADDCRIFKNHVSLINLEYADNNLITKNNISELIYLIRSCYGNIISNNNINLTSAGTAVHLYGLSSNNQIINNVFTNGGLLIRSAFNNIVENNSVNGKPLLYLEGGSNLIIDDAKGIFGQIVVIRSSNIIVENAHLSNTNIGIEFYETRNSRIRNCNLSANLQGIYLGASSDNIIENNIISYNQHTGVYISGSRGNIIINNIFKGVSWWQTALHVHHYFSTDNVGTHILFNNFTDCELFLDRSSGNYIYLNNFISSSIEDGVYSTTNIWNTPLDTDYIFEDTSHTNFLGNYWSDYTGADLNNDGIGDSSHAIVWNDEDNYPLIEPFENYKSHAGVKVTLPNGGENWLVGSYQHIEWETFLLSESNVTIELSTDGGTSWKETILANTANDGTATWRVMAYSGNQLQIRVVSVESPSVSDASDKDFSISTASTTNTFPEGYCTWWAYERRAQLEIPIEWLNDPDLEKPRDAWKWFNFAQQKGVATGSEPKVGAIAVWGYTPTNSYGHVAIVEWVEGSMFGISEMNFGSFVNPSEGKTVNFRKVTDRTLTLPRPSGENFLGFIYSKAFKFNVLWEDKTYPVVVFSNSTIGQLNFSQSLSGISFEASGESATTGYCNVTIPKALLWANATHPWTVKIEGTTWEYTISENDTYSFIYFTYVYASTLQVEIIGTWVIPEFPSFLILPLFMIATLIAVIVYRRKQP